MFPGFTRQFIEIEKGVKIILFKIHFHFDNRGSCIFHMVLCNLYHES